MLVFLILSFFSFAHPVHVTLMSVEYSKNTDVFNVYLKVYSDDFLLDYRILTGDTSKIDLASGNDKARKVISRYLKDKVQIFAENKKLDGRIVKLDCSEGELKLELVYNISRKSKRYLVKNLILTDIYKDQSNLLIFRYGSFEEGIKLTPEKQEQEFNIK